MKQLTSAAAALLLAVSARADTLLTPSFSIEIKVHCAEGDVSCDKVGYVGKNRKTGSAVSLRGKTLHTLCADGVTPCRFLGYEFKNGDVRYRVLESGELLVTQGKKVLVQEQGEWRY